ncbi:MAG: flagellin lysine-N-methylase [Eubacteriales bacterium]|nr:flagellin lysine-N-methylase [Eubacteriales bacterium]
MLKVYPDYYGEFTCIADKCRHNCCIGWEIDIDLNTYGFYRSQGGEFARRFAENIRHGDTPCFIPDENERCPFLNGKNLCDIITEFGEEHLCEICRQHPRFHNEFTDRTESGLGLACEECARIIILRQEPMMLINSETSPCEEISLRDDIIKLLQNRDLTVAERFSGALYTLNTEPAKVTLLSFARFLFSLERLSTEWDRLLAFFISNCKEEENPEFARHMSSRMTEYENFAVYLIYRHFACNKSSCRQVAKFAELMYRFLYCAAKLIFEKTGDFTRENQVELMRLFSSEIEYSDENLRIILDSI